MVVEAKCVAGKIKPPEETGFHMKHCLFTPILEIFVKAREEMHQHLQHCCGVMEFMQVENWSSKHVFGK